MEKIPQIDFYSAKQSYISACLKEAQGKYRDMLKRVKAHDDGVLPLQIAESAQLLMDCTTTHSQIIWLRLALRETKEAMIYGFDPALNDRDLK